MAETKETIFFKNTPQETTLVFYPNSHWYKLKGEKSYLLSPSSIVGKLDKSKALEMWRTGLMRDYLSEKIEARQYDGSEVITLCEKMIGLHEEKLETAKDVGTMAHEYAELFAYHQVDGQPAPEIPFYADEQTINAINSFKDLVEAHNIKVLEVEKFIFSPSKKYAGRFDAICEIDGEKHLVDFKTSKDVYSSHCYQLAGYHIAMEEECAITGQPLPYEKLSVLHFGKDTGVATIKTLTEEEVELSKTAFLGLLAVKKAEKVMSKYG